MGAWSTSRLYQFYRECYEYELLVLKEKMPWLGSESWNRMVQGRTRAKAEKES